LQGTSHRTAKVGQRKPHAKSSRKPKRRVWGSTLAQKIQHKNSGEGRRGEKGSSIATWKGDGEILEKFTKKKTRDIAGGKRLAKNGGATPQETSSPRKKNSETPPQSWTQKKEKKSTTWPMSESVVRPEKRTTQQRRYGIRKGK